jgi:hypothetical protein
VSFGMNNPWADREGMTDDHALLRGALGTYLTKVLPTLPAEEERRASREKRRAVR